MLEINPDEKIILKVRRHKLALVFETLFLVFFIILPPLFFWLSGQAVSIKGNDTALFTGVYSMIILLAWVIFFIIWTNYYLDVLIITDKRVIDVEQKGFFNREVSTVRMENIQDITVNVSGIVATFMNYGTLRIQTAAENREFIMHDVPEPDMVKSKIYELHNKAAEAPKSVKIAG